MFTTSDLIIIQSDAHDTASLHGWRNWGYWGTYPQTFTWHAMCLSNVVSICQCRCRLRPCYSSWPVWFTITANWVPCRVIALPIIHCWKTKSVWVSLRFLNIYVFECFWVPMSSRSRSRSDYRWLCVLLCGLNPFLCSELTVVRGSKIKWVTKFGCLWPLDPRVRNIAQYIK